MTCYNDRCLTYKISFSNASIKLIKKCHFMKHLQRYKNCSLYDQKNVADEHQKEFWMFQQ